jgi:hypothetical protein
MKGWFARLRRRGAVTRSAVLVGAVLLVYAGVAPVAGMLSGPAGLAAAAVAAGLCLGGGLVALLTARRSADPSGAMLGVLTGMLVRIGVPLFSGLAIQVHGGRLAQAGLLVYLVVFYPVTLWVETALSLPGGDGERGSRGGSEEVCS